MEMSWRGIECVACIERYTRGWVSVSKNVNYLALPRIFPSTIYVLYIIFYVNEHISNPICKYNCSPSISAREDDSEFNTI